MKEKKSPPVVVVRRAPVDPDYLSLRATAETLGLSVSSLKRIVALHPDFPQPVRLSTKVVLFDRLAVRQWMERQAQGAALAARQSNGLPVAPITSLRGQVEGKAPKPLIARKH